MTRRGARRRAIGFGALALGAIILPPLASRQWWEIGAGLALCLVAAAIAVEDMARMLIPDGLTLAIGAIAVTVFAFQGGDPAGFGRLALLALGTAVTLFAVSQTYAWLRGREGIGFGDVKLVGASALLVGPWGVALQILLAATAAIFFVIIRAARRGRSLRAAARIPFATFLAPSLVIVWAWLGPFP